MLLQCSVATWVFHHNNFLRCLVDVFHSGLVCTETVQAKCSPAHYETTLQWLVSARFGFLPQMTETMCSRVALSLHAVYAGHAPCPGHLRLNSVFLLIRLGQIHISFPMPLVSRLPSRKHLIKS